MHSASAAIAPLQNVSHAVCSVQCADRRAKNAKNNRNACAWFFYTMTVAVNQPRAKNANKNRMYNPMGTPPAKLRNDDSNWEWCRDSTV